MTTQTMDHDLRPLNHSLRAARNRLWLQRGARMLLRSLCVALAVALVAALLAGWRAPESVRSWIWMAAGAALLAGLSAALLSRPSLSEAARALDLSLGLQQQLGTAHELLSQRANGLLVPFQIARASALADGLPIASAFPLLPKRESGIALLLATATGTLLLLVSSGLVLPNPLSTIRLPSPFQETSRPAEEDAFGSLREADPPPARSAALEPVGRMLDEIQLRAQVGSLSSAAASAALSRANAELNRVANESRLRQEGLDDLADELRGTAAGREIAEGLRRGDYGRAAEQMRELGRESDQLSASAKQDLANALNRAASRSQGAEELSRSEGEAARALEQRDYSSTVQSMDRLAESVQRAAEQVVPQSELAETWRRLDELSRQLGQPGVQAGQEQRGLSPPTAQGTQGAGERRTGPQQGAPNGELRSGLAPSEGSLGRPAGGAPAGGAPGDARGGNPLGAQSPRLGPDGKPLDVEGQIGDRFPGQPASGSQSPSVLREGRANSGPSSTRGAEGPLSVPAENVFVPGDRRPTVRDYFSGGSGGQ
ncbi:MAG: hypothetical protein ACM3US_01475 [Sphingomonadaceae bacterium]